MSPRAVCRREDRALVSVWSRRIFLDREFVGRVHSAEGNGWVAEFRGRVLGTYPTERLAIRAVLDAGRRA